MPQPGKSAVHDDKILTNYSLQYSNEMRAFVAAAGAPPVRVNKESDKYFTFTKADWLRDPGPNTVRGPGSGYARSGYALSTATYSVDQYALEKPIDDRTRGNTDRPLDPDRNATQFLVEQLLIRMEVMYGAAAFATSIWATDGTVSNKWSDYTNGDPSKDVETAKDTIRKSTGRDPNTIIIGALTWRRLKFHPDLLGAFQYVERALLTQAMVAEYFDVDRFFVARAVYNSANEGATASMGYILNDDAFWMGYVDPNAGIESPTAMKMFNTQGTVADNILAPEIFRYRQDEIDSDIIRASFTFDIKIVGTDLGYFIADVAD